MCHTCSERSCAHNGYLRGRGWITEWESAFNPTKHINLSLRWLYKLCADTLAGHVPGTLAKTVVLFNLSNSLNEIFQITQSAKKSKREGFSNWSHSFLCTLIQMRRHDGKGPFVSIRKTDLLFWQRYIQYWFSNLHSGPNSSSTEERLLTYYFCSPKQKEKKTPKRSHFVCVFRLMCICSCMHWTS